MVSGSLMLDESKKITVKNILFKYVRNIGILLVIWSVIYTCVDNILFPVYYGQSIDVSSVISQFVLGRTHLWYLYMLIGLYLITPFLRMFVNKEHKDLVLLFIVISLIVQFSVPILNELTAFSDKFEILIQFIKKFEAYFFSGYTAYYLAGWYLTHIDISKFREKTIRIMCLPAIILIIVYVQTSGDYIYGYMNTNLIIFIYAVGAFMFLYSIPVGKLKKQTQNIIVHLSQLSFGVYIAHILVIMVLDRIIPKLYFAPLDICISEIGTIVISFFGCYIASKIPGICKLVRM